MKNGQCMGITADLCGCTVPNSDRRTFVWATMTMLVEFSNDTGDDGFALSRPPQPRLYLETDGYAALIERHRDMLMAYIAKIVGNSSMAEDVCQETFLQGYLQFPMLRDKEAFPCWLRTIARRTAFAEIARRKREVPTDPQGMDDSFVMHDAPTSPCVKDHYINLVQQCVSSLPERLCLCFRLYYYEGMRTEEIALQLKTSSEAVLKRLERARGKISRSVTRKLRLDGVTLDWKGRRIVAR